MRSLTLPLLFCSLLTAAQPGDPSFLLHIDPCGMPMNEGVDLSGDGIPDLLISGLS